MSNKKEINKTARRPPSDGSLPSKKDKTDRKCRYQEGKPQLAPQRRGCEGFTVKYFERSSTLSELLRTERTHTP